jgi:hypothetical protein
MPEGLMVMASLLVKREPSPQGLRAGFAAAQTQAAVAQQLADQHR